MGYSAIMEQAHYMLSRKVIAANQTISLTSMTHVMMKMLEHRLIKKDGPAVPRLVITSLVFIVDLAIGLTISINFDVVKTLNNIDKLYS